MGTIAGIITMEMMTFTIITIAEIFTMEMMVLIIITIAGIITMKMMVLTIITIATIITITPIAEISFMMMRKMIFTTIMFPEQATTKSNPGCSMDLLFDSLCFKSQINSK